MAASAFATPAGGTSADQFVQQGGQTVDSAKMAALQAIAQQGASAKQAYDQAQAGNGAAKTQALRDAMAYASVRGAPVANQAAATQTISAPIDTAQTLAGLQQSNYAQNNQATGSAFGQYFDLTKAGLPIAQAGLKSTIANDQEKAAERAMVLSADLQGKNLANQLATQKLQNAGQKAQTPAQIIAALGGPAIAGQVISSQADSNLGAEQTQGYGNAARGAGTGPSGTGGGNFDPLGDTPTEVGAQVGLSPAYVGALVGAGGQKQAQEGKSMAPPAAPTGGNARLNMLATGMSAQNYAQAYNGSLNAITAGATAQQVVSQIQSLGFNLQDAQLIYSQALSDAQRSKTYANS